MAKRSHTEVIEAEAVDGQPFPKTSHSGPKRATVDDEMGEFEDPWEDDMESDDELREEVVNDADAMDVDVDGEVLPSIEESDELPPPPRVYIPGIHELGPDEVLEPDDTVYIMRHHFTVDWPCLSFDVLRDNLGDQRQRYPATMYLVAGTQADRNSNNEVVVYKLSSLYRTQTHDEDSDTDDDTDDDLDEDPIIEKRSIPHMGGVNRIRAQPLPPAALLPPVSQPYYAATWAETGKVHVWDIRPLMESLDVPGYTIDKSRTQKPSYTINSHGRAEGFAMDWAASGPSSLRLLTGDIHSKIYLTTATQSNFTALSQPFTSHTSSVEDLQWSPTDPTVFASCSSDQSIRIWDVRTKGRRSAVGIQAAHPSDVNVISWNKSTSYLLLSGGDEGGIKVWDLRNVQKSSVAPTPVASFTWHKSPITSIEWHPTEDSSFAASSEDGQVTLWDLAVEQDDDEMAESGDIDVPSQLLFSHPGQKNVKEAHWHPQIPGVVISTAEQNSFNVFKPFNFNV